MNNDTYFESALTHLQNKFPEKVFEAKDKEKMSVKFSNKENQDDYKVLSLYSPFQFSEGNNFQSWETDLEDFFRKATTSAEFDLESAKWDDVKNSVLPQIKRADQFEQVALDLREAPHKLITMPFMDDLQIGFVVDQPEGFIYIADNIPEIWGISIEELEKTALLNLKQLPATQSGPKMIENGDNTISFFFETFDGYDAARILLNEMHDFFHEQFKGDYLVAIPHRDMLFASPPHLEQKLLGFTMDIFTKSAHPITSKVYVFK